jgi:hypothetical protein
MKFITQLFLACAVAFMLYALQDVFTSSGAPPDEVHVHAHGGINLTFPVAFWNNQIKRRLPEADQYQFVIVGDCSHSDICFQPLVNGPTEGPGSGGVAMIAEGVMYVPMYCFGSGDNPQYVDIHGNAISCFSNEGQTGGVIERAFFHELLHSLGYTHVMDRGEIMHSWAIYQTGISTAELKALNQLSDIGYARRLWLKIYALMAMKQPGAANAEGGRHE